MALAGAAMVPAAASASTATVFEGYGYSYGGFDGVAAWVVASGGNIDDVKFNGFDFGAGANGNQSGFFYMGDNEGGPNNPVTVDIFVGSGHASGTFNDVIGDQDCGGCGSVSVGSLSASGAPEPTTWALMLAGFGGMGAALRASRRKATAATA